MLPPPTETNPDVSRTLTQILKLLQTQQTQQAQQARRARALPPAPVPDPPPAVIVQTPPAPDVFATATASLDARVGLSQGNMNILDHLSRKTQRKVRESSLDSITFAEFVYGFIGIILEAGVPEQPSFNMLNFLRNIAEDTEFYSWPGTLDWALTTIDKLNSNSITWSSEQAIAMDRLVLSRSVSNAKNFTTIPCPEYNTGTCSFKSVHVDGRFKLEHMCAFCAPQGIEHAHTERVCHRKKSFNGGNQKQNYKNEFRSRPRRFDAQQDSKN